MTVNAVRVRLGKLVEKMFTQEFRDVYAASVPKMEKDAGKHLLHYLDKSDAYIRTIAMSLDNAELIEAINRSIDKTTFAPVVFCVGLRYHLLTCTLMEEPQDKELDVPESDESFFVHMLIDSCEEPL